MNFPPDLADALSRRIDWNLLRTFHDIVQAKGISAAANKTWRKQSTLSLSLKRLEDSVGCRLCNRGRAGFSLTEEGVIFYDYVRGIYRAIGDMQSALEDSRECMSGNVRIAIISNFTCHALNTAFVRFREQFPRVTLSVDVRTWEGISKHIINNDHDVGVSPFLDPHCDLKYDFLATEYHNIYCGRNHHLFGKSPCLDALAEESFVLTGSDEPDTLTSFRLRHRLGKRITARTPNLEEARRLAMAGVGVCILPEEFVQCDVAGGSLWPLMVRSRELSCDVYIITNLRAPKRRTIEALTAELLAGSADPAEV